MIGSFVALLKDDDGLALVEYAVIAAAIAIPMMLVATLISNGTGSALNSTANGFQNFNQSPP